MKLSFAKVRVRDTAVNLASAHRPMFPRQLWGRTHGCFQKGNPIFSRFRHWQDLGTFLRFFSFHFSLSLSISNILDFCWNSKEQNSYHFECKCQYIIDKKVMLLNYIHASDLHLIYQFCCRQYVKLFSVHLCFGGIK